MTRRILFLDAVLVTVLVIGVLKFREDWAAFESIRQVSAIQVQPEAFPVIPLNAASAASETADWTEIATLNPFSFDRNDVAIMKAVPPPVPSGPKPILFGTMSLGADPIAMLAPGQAGNRNYLPVKVGEVVDGWTLLEIQQKSVVVASNGIQQTLIMNDPTARVPRAAGRSSANRTAPPPVIIPNAQPAPSAAAPAAPGAPPGMRRVTIQTPFGTIVRDEPIQ